jgi:Raf kinase inhibitor-like YbhB/YbcL family protein
MILQTKWLVVSLACGAIVLSVAAFSRRVLYQESHHQIAKNIFQLTSPVFANGEMIPVAYTCDGQNISPALNWKNVPSGTQSFVITCVDPDTLESSWVHWLIYDLPANVTALERHVKVESLNGKLGLNSWDKPAYGGPCPPIKNHRYIFTIYALTISHLPLESVPTYEQVMSAMKGQVLGQAVLMGRYQRTMKQ